MLNSITEKLKEQLVTDMNHGKVNSDKQKSNIPNLYSKKDDDEEVDNVSKAVPPIHLVKQITEEIYNNLDKRYPLNKPVLNSRVTVVHARPGEEEQFLPIQHAGTQVRLNKKTGEYQICYVDKNAVNSGVNSVRFVNGSVHEDKEQRKKLWQQFDEKLRNIRAGLSPTVMVTTSSTPVTTAPSSGERRTRKKRRRVVKIVRVRRRKTTTPEPVSSSDDVEQSKASEETSDISDKSKQVSAASESKTSEKSEISDIKETKQKVKKKKKIVSKRRKVGRKSNVTEKPVIAITEVHKEKKKLEKIIETVPNITQIHETYSAVALKSSEENKNTYFTSEKIIHIASSSLSPAQINISTSEIPVTTTLGIPFIVTTKPTLVAITGLPQSEEYRNMTTKSFKRIIRNMTSFSTYLYSKYDTVGTKQTTARSKIPTTLTTAQPSRTTPVESSSEFLISSSESTESSIFAATTESLEIPEITEPSVSSEIVESTKELDTRRSTLSSQSAEDLAARTTTELIRSSEEQSASKLQTDSFKSSEEHLKSTTMRKSLETLKDFTTLPQVTSTEESHKSLETLLSVSAVKSVEDNATCIASTSNIITADVKTFITKMLSSTYSEYGTEKPTEEVTDLADDVSKHITEFTTFPTTAASTSASTVGPTISEVTAESPTKTILSTTEIIEQPTETSTEIQSATEHTTSVWWPLPTVVFKTYDTLRSTTYTKKGTIQPSVYGEGWPKGGRYKYQPYSSRSLGSRYKPNLPVTYKSYWDKQRHRHGRYGRPRKFVAPKYTWQHGRWILADIPESATLMPVTTTVSAEDTGISLVETKHSTMVTKQGEKYMTTSTYKEQHTISSFIQEDELKTLPFIEEDWTTAVSIQKKEHEKFGSHEVNLTSSPIIKENHTTLLPDRQTPTTYSSDKRQKTVEPSETYTVSQTSVEIQETVVTSRDEEYITSSTSPHPMFQTHEEQTIMLPKEMHMQHVTKYITVPTTSKVKGTTLRPEHEEFTTVHSLPVDRNTVQPPFAKKYTTFSDAFEIKHTTLHPIYEKHSPESSLPPMWKPEIDKEHYSTEPPPTVDTHIAWTPYYEISATILSEHKHRTSPPVAPFTVKDVHAMSETLPHLPAVTKEVPSYKGPKFEWPVFDIKNIFTTVSPLLKSFPETTLRHQIHEDIHITDTVVSENQTPKVEITTSKHIDEESLSPIEESYVTEKSFITESIIFTEKPDVIDRSTTSSADITTVGLDTLAITPSTEDEYSLLKVIPDTDLISSEEGMVKKIFVNPFKAVKKFFKDSSESVPVSQEQHYINYDKPNDTASYDFNDIYDEPYFDKNATKQYFTKLRLNGTYVTLRTIYRRPSNFTFPPVLTEKPATQPPVIATARTHKPSVTAKVGLFGFMKHRAKKTLKNIVNFFTPDLSDEEEEMRRMRKNTMNSLEKDGDDDDDGH